MTGRSGGVSPEVGNDGVLELQYGSMTIAEAVEMIRLLREFMPSAQFSIQPVRH